MQAVLVVAIVIGGAVVIYVAPTILQGAQTTSPTLTTTPTTTATTETTATSPSPTTTATSAEEGQVTLTFVASGLPPGISWGVSLVGILQTSTIGTITFSISLGTHDFTVSAPPGYSANPPSGSFDITEAPPSPIEFPIQFGPSTTTTTTTTGPYMALQYYQFSDC
jgi:hypothetical protein